MNAACASSLFWLAKKVCLPFRACKQGRCNNIGAYRRLLIEHPCRELGAAEGFRHGSGWGGQGRCVGAVTALQRSCAR